MEKIWGLYNTIEDIDLINELDEIDLWKKIDNLGETLFYMNHDYDRLWCKSISKEQLLEAQYNLEYLVYLTRKFGVEFSREPSAFEYVERSESYNAWFKFWHDFFENMDYEKYNNFIEDKFNGKDISKYMPHKSWKDNLNKPFEKVLK